MAHLPPEDLRFVLSKRSLSNDAAVCNFRRISLENFHLTDPFVEARLRVG